MKKKRSVTVGSQSREGEVAAWWHWLHEEKEEGDREVTTMVAVGVGLWLHSC